MPRRALRLAENTHDRNHRMWWHKTEHVLYHRQRADIFSQLCEMLSALTGNDWQRVHLRNDGIPPWRRWCTIGLWWRLPRFTCVPLSQTCSRAGKLSAIRNNWQWSRQKPIRDSLKGNVNYTSADMMKALNTNMTDLNNHYALQLIGWVDLHTRKAVQGVLRRNRRNFRHPLAVRHHWALSPHRITQQKRKRVR